MTRYTEKKNRIGIYTCSINVFLERFAFIFVLTHDPTSSYSKMNSMQVHSLVDKTELLKVESQDKALWYDENKIYCCGGKTPKSYSSLTNNNVNKIKWNTDLHKYAEPTRFNTSTKNLSYYQLKEMINEQINKKRIEYKQFGFGLVTKILVWKKILF